MPALFLCATTSHTQICIGQPSLARVHVNASANVQTASQGLGFEGRVGIGGNHAFGGAGVGTISYDKGQKLRSYMGSVIAGYSVQLGSLDMHVCPVASLQMENGPDNIVVEPSELVGFGGLSLGGAAKLSNTLSLLPFFGGGFQRIRLHSKRFNQSAANIYSQQGVAILTGIGLQVKEQYLLHARVKLYSSTQPDNEPRGSFILGVTYAPSGRR